MQMLRRRTMMGASGGEDPWADWVKASLRNYGTIKGVYGGNLTKLSRMVIDGLEVTPTKTYDFGDVDYHTIYYLFNDLTTLPTGAFMVGNYIFRAIDVPASFVTYEGNSLRTLGAVARCDAALRSTIYPSMTSTTLLANSSTHIYVPASVYDDYVAAGVIAASRIHLINEYTWDL